MIRVGQRLKEARLSKGISIEDAAHATRIRPAFLSAIEKGEYTKLPSSSYALGFVQNYAEYLGLPRREILALFRREFDEEKVYKVLPENFVKDEQMPARGLKIHQAVFLIIGVLLLLGGFLLFQYRGAFISPPLTVSSPKEGAVTSSDVVVRGKTDPNVTLNVNNSPVTVEQDGSFIKTVTVFPGKASIVVKASNRFGKETAVFRQVTVRSAPADSTSNP